MPVPLGHFISKHVYARRLKTVHPDDTLLAVRLIDIPGSEASQGRSWIVCVAGFLSVVLLVLILVLRT
jgi:hypothetical protein